MVILFNLWNLLISKYCFIILFQSLKLNVLQHGDCPPGGEPGDNSNDEADFRVNNGVGPAKKNSTCEENESDSDGDVVCLSVEDVPAEHNSNMNTSLNFNPSRM